MASQIMSVEDVMEEDTFYWLTQIFSIYLNQSMQSKKCSGIMPGVLQEDMDRGDQAHQLHCRIDQLISLTNHTVKVNHHLVIKMSFGEFYFVSVGFT